MLYNKKFNIENDIKRFEQLSNSTTSKFNKIRHQLEMLKSLSKKSQILAVSSIFSIISTSFRLAKK